MNKTLCTIILSTTSFVGCNSSTRENYPAVTGPTRQIHIVPTAIEKKSCERESECYFIVGIANVSSPGTEIARASCIYRQIQGNSLEQMRAKHGDEIQRLEKAMKTGNYFATDVKANDPKVHPDKGENVVLGHSGCYEAIMPLAIWPSLAPPERC